MITKVFCQEEAQKQFSFVSWVFSSSSPDPAGEAPKSEQQLLGKGPLILHPPGKAMLGEESLTSAMSTWLFSKLVLRMLGRGIPALTAPARPRERLAAGKAPEAASRGGGWDLGWVWKGRAQPARTVNGRHVCSCEDVRHPSFKPGRLQREEAQVSTRGK